MSAPGAADPWAIAGQPSVAAPANQNAPAADPWAAKGQRAPDSPYLGMAEELERSQAAADAWNKAHPEAPKTIDQITSPKGAVGRYQIMPSTAQLFGLDPNRLADPAYNRLAANLVLGELQQRYGNDRGAIAIAYNAGPQVADRWIKSGRKIETLPAETRDYVERATDPWTPDWTAPPPAAPQKLTAPGAMAPAPQVPQKSGTAPTKPEASWADVLSPNIASAWSRMKQAGIGMAEQFYNEDPSKTAQASLLGPAGSLIAPFFPSLLTDAQKKGLEQSRAPVNSWFAKAGADVAQDIRANTPDMEPGSAKSVSYQVLAGVTDMVPALAAMAATKNPYVGAAIIGAQAGGTKYAEAIGSGRTHEQASMDATFDAMVNGGMGVLPMHVLMKPGRSFLASTLKNAGAFGVQSVATEAMQIGYDKGLINQNMTLKDAWGRLEQAGIVGTLTGAFLGGGHAGLEPAYGRLHASTARAQPVAEPRVEPVAASPVQPAPEAPVRHTAGPVHADLEASIGLRPRGAPDADPWAPAAESSKVAENSPSTVAESPSSARTADTPPPEPSFSTNPAKLRQEHELEIAQLEGQGAEAAARRVAPVPSMDTAAEPHPDAVNPLSEGIPRRPLEQDVAITASGRQVPVRYAVVEAAHLVPSQTQDGNPNPNFPAELQPRDRTRAVSQAQVASIAQNINPRLLDRSVNAADGAPIISSSGIVESGNGRSLALQRAYAQGMPSAEQYRDYLAQQGYPVEGMTAPVLVRVREGDMAPADRQAFVREANQSGQLGHSATERAMSDAAALPEGALDLYRGGDVENAGNRDFVRSFMRAAVPENEHAGMIDAHGGLSQDAVRRVRAALLAKAYASPDLVAGIVESQDSNTKAIGGALTDAAADWAKMRGKVAAGEIPASMDQTSQLLDAVKLVEHARAEGRNVAEYVAQPDIFTGEAVEPDVEAWLRLMFRNTKDWTQPVGREKLADALRYYAQEAQKAKVAPDLLGQGPVPVESVLAQARARQERDYGRQAQTALFQRPPVRPGEGVRPGSSAGDGSEPESAAARGSEEAARDRDQSAAGPHGPVTETPQFKRWFGDSKVTDKNGKPQIVFHGSNRDFSTFKPTEGMRRDAWGPQRVTSPAFFFASDRDAARVYARDRVLIDQRLRGLPGGRPRTRAFYLKVESPLDLTGGRFGGRVPEPEAAAILGRALTYEEGDGPQTWAEVHQALDDPEVVAWLQRQGYDGARLREESGAESWAAFDPTQIKSATSNRGTFDPNNPSTLHEIPRQFGKRGAIQGKPSVRLSPDLAAELPATPTAAEQRVLDQVGVIAKKIVPRANVTPARALFAIEGRRMAPVHGAAVLDGARRIISYSLQSPDAAGTMRHEAIHWLRHSNFIDPSEWSTLEKAAQTGNWIGKYDINGRYPMAAPEIKIEESIAEAFAKWRRAPAGLPRSVHPIFEKVAQFFTRVAGHLRKAFGQDATSDDIFSRITSGEVGNRSGQPGLDTGTRFEVPTTSPNPPGLIDRLKERASDASEIVRAAQMAISPMTVGDKTFRATAKDFANLKRLSRDRAMQEDQHLQKDFTPAQRKAMFRAADEQSIAMQQGKSTDDIGLAKLSPEERAAVQRQQADAQSVWNAMKQAGMVQGEGIPSYVPHLYVEMAETGAKRIGDNQVRSIPGMGRNLSTSSSHMKQRKYLTGEEGSAALSKKSGKDAHMLDDIRVLPLATMRMRDALAGRALINKVKELGASLGEDTVVEGGQPNEPGWFTMDHPSFSSWRPKFITDKLTGKIAAATDQNGEPVFEKVPIYVRGDFEGPLRAVLSQDSGKVYNALMQMKGKVMNNIMFSPLVQLHLMTELGRALPVSPMKVVTLKILFDGNKAKQDPATRTEAIMHGMVPISHQGAMVDVSSIAEPDNIRPGRSWTAQIVGAIPGWFDPRAGDTVKRGIDRMGDFLHNTLLWNRVQDLQFGLYTTMRDHLVADKRFDPNAAQYMAAHWANRYAGTLPVEAMSTMARKIANIALFSRTYTLGNMGVVKDVVTGLPMDIQAQIARDGGTAALAKAVSTGRRKTASILAVDIALLYAANSIAQNAFGYFSGRQTGDQIWQGYADRMRKLGELMNRDPLAVANPISDLDRLSATAENEIDETTGKPLQRILVGYDKQGTAIYARNPFGKFAEEMSNWVEAPGQTVKSKLSPFVKPGLDALTNDKGFGRHLYDANDPAQVIIGKIAQHYMEGQIPMDQLTAMADLLSGKAKSTDALKIALRTVGVTVRRGYPGGPAVGLAAQVERAHFQKIDAAMPDIIQQIKDGDVTGARAAMQALHIPPRRQLYYIQSAQHPGRKAGYYFNKFATPEDRARMQELRGTQP